MDGNGPGRHRRHSGLRWRIPSAERSGKLPARENGKQEAAPICVSSVASAAFSEGESILIDNGAGTVYNFYAGVRIFEHQHKCNNRKQVQLSNGGQIPHSSKDRGKRKTVIVYQYEIEIGLLVLLGLIILFAVIRAFVRAARRKTLLEEISGKVDEISEALNAMAAEPEQKHSEQKPSAEKTPEVCKVAEAQPAGKPGNDVATEQRSTVDQMRDALPGDFSFLVLRQRITEKGHR